MGKVFPVGAGPGDPDHLKALRVWQHAEVVVCDRPASAEILTCASRALLITGRKRSSKQHHIAEERVAVQSLRVFVAGNGMRLCRGLTEAGAARVWTA